ncbi:tRNA (N(6)-L-threonylcarbamoyladenosine(37)-C(2))-methylthiotransferase MtaB [Zavarzinia sp. CC-PAN008]|uniref:tRNA (N(6)-L-threonylcarbamoyladenosine(37)-C(2))- methylthiotransferase MtaB n=1 Tax=Zavarzinia sp. CC-PAN008 TaxID=3243332 RepID=UPI003F74824A
MTEVITFGCRLNAAESELMRGHAQAAGLDDAIIVNTCAVTSEAERQARQTIRRLRRERPDACIIVTGCAAQIAPDTYAGMPEVDHVVGQVEKLAPQTFQALAGDGAPARLLAPFGEVEETAGHLIAGFGGRARAFVPVQNGCDHACTFCTIPAGRGPSRSQPMGFITDQVRRLVEAGHREVVLTGVDLTAYGEDLPGKPTLGALVRRLLKAVPELPRLRISSIDTAEVDADLRRALAEEERLMPHLHLSLQAGDDLILKRMKRRHSRADSVALCADLRRLRPDLVLGADLIAGFPTETEAAFANTLALVEDCGLTWLHVFPFSPRPGTPAARMPQVPASIARERARQLRARGAAAVQAFLEREVGRERTALVEENGQCRTEHFAPLRLDQAALPGALVRVRVTGVAGGAGGSGVEPASLVGHIVTAGGPAPSPGP